MQSWWLLKSLKTWTCDSLLQGPSHSLSTSITFAWECKVHLAFSQLTRSPGAPHSSPPAVVRSIILFVDKDELKMFSSENCPVNSRPSYGSYPSLRLMFDGLYSSSSPLYSSSPSSCPSTTRVFLLVTESTDRQTRVHWRWKKGVSIRAAQSDVFHNRQSFP